MVIDIFSNVILKTKFEYYLRSYTFCGNIPQKAVSHMSVHCHEQSYPLKCQTKIAADDILFFYFYLLKKIRLDFFM